ncbi:hypothetical protein HaLaN_01730 [Haematococcus lacustris]|uniref:Uncharacterized protein n=1 Tax=Haematococcus lacustris TaxID=44745 RepID=A0A699Y9X1_HAELA|nr:hypothetical protein HaLaN_01730 [Haematococcus lacustris]
MNSPQPCEEELDSSKPTRPEDWKPKPGQVATPRKASGKEYPALGIKKLRDQAPKALAQQPVAHSSSTDSAHLTHAPQPGRWLDRDCNVALNVQRIV